MINDLPEPKFYLRRPSTGRSSPRLNTTGANSFNMPSAKTKTAGRTASGRLPADALRLLELIISEVESPTDTQKLLDRFPQTDDCREESLRFLKAKDRAQRRADFIANEALWWRKYGWFMARIVGLFGLLVFVFAMSVRGAGVDFITFALLGAAGYYLLLMTLSNIRYREKNKKRRKLIEHEQQQYQRAILSVAASLLKKFQADPALYPIAKPRIRAGLIEREDGYFIPVE